MNKNLEHKSLNQEPPKNEPERQYYFIEKCRRYVNLESNRLGRALNATVVNFGCQMNTEHEIEKAA